MKNPQPRQPASCVPDGIWPGTSAKAKLGVLRLELGHKLMCFFSAQSNCQSAVNMMLDEVSHPPFQAKQKHGHHPLFQAKALALLSEARWIA